MKARPLIDDLWRTLIWLLIGLAIGLGLFGCSATTQRSEDAARHQRETTVTVSQQMTPDGQLIELTTKVVRILDEETNTAIAQEVSVPPPKLLGQLAGAAATLVAGPAAGRVAEQATDWITTTLVGGGAAATAAGTGWAALHRPQVARRRKLEEELAEMEEALAAADAKARRSEEALRHVTRGIQRWKDSLRAADGPENPAIASLHDALEKSTDDNSRAVIRQAKAVL